MKKSSVLLTGLAFVAMNVTASSQTTSPSTTADVLRQAKTYLYQFRAGQYDVAPKFVAMMQEATKADPDNAELWYNMGFAYLAQAAGAMLTGGNSADALIAAQQGPKALERALQLNPNHAEALAVHGGMQAMMATFLHAPEQAAKGVADMNRAVEIAPKSARVRLARAFNGLSLPDTLRDHKAEVEDLDFLIQISGGGRAGDYLRIMRGDLYFELSKLDLARNDYEAVSQSASPAAPEAGARLAALSQAGVDVASIRKLRSAAGANCAMCHGR